MRYRAPFTAEQRRDAISKYRSFRENYRQLRKLFPPLNREQRNVLRDYRDLIREFGIEASGRARSTGAYELNQLELKANTAVVMYYQLRGTGGTRT